MKDEKMIIYTQYTVYICISGVGVFTSQQVKLMIKVVVLITIGTIEVGSRVQKY